MKKNKVFFISILFLAVWLNVSAGLRNESSALGIANGFFNQGLLRSSAGSADLVYTAEDDSKNPCFYIFNNSNLKKFVIVSAQDKTKKILGYSDSSNFNVDSIPDEMKFILSYYTVNISAIAKDSTYKVADADASNRSLSSVKPLLGDNNYSQDYPFNDYCPSLDSQKCVLGCGALSLVQIMSYNKWPLSSQGAVSYEYILGGDTVSVSESLVADYDWDSIKEYYDDELTQVQKDAVAKLCYNTALACKTRFGVYASFSSFVDIFKVFVSNFKYDSDIRTIYRNTYPEAEWNKKIESELSDGRPIEIISCNFTQTDSVTHAFVCDGYDENDLFHINWGWNGLYNGYYDLSIMSLKNEINFNYSLTAILDIKKEDGVSFSAIPYSLKGFTSCSKEKDLSNDISLSFENLYFENIFSKSCYLGLALYSDDGGLEKVDDIKMDSVYSYNVFVDSILSVFSFPQNIDDGFYTISLVYKDNLGSDWKNVYVADSSGAAINVKVQNNKISCFIAKETKNFDLCIEGLGTEILYNNGQKRSIRVDVRNDGDEYYNDVYLKLVCVDDTSTKFSFPDSRLLFIHKGESRTYLFTGVMDSIPLGDYYVSLMYKDESVSEGDMQEKIYMNDTLIVSKDEVPSSSLSIVSTDIKDVVYDRNDISFSVKIRNIGGEYCGDILLVFINDTAIYFITNSYVSIVKEEVVNFKGAANVPNGRYQAFFASGEILEYINSSTDTDYYINVGDVGTSLDEGSVDNSNVVNCFYSKNEESLLVNNSDVCISKVVVYSITGKRMLVCKAKNIISMSGLSSGVYIAEIFFDDGRSKKIKFIK